MVQSAGVQIEFSVDGVAQTVGQLKNVREAAEVARQAVEAGYLSQQAAERQLTAVTILETEKRLEAVKKAIEEQKKIQGGLETEQGQKLLAEQQRIALELAVARQKQEKQKQQDILTGIQAEEALLRQSFAQKLISEEEFNTKRIALQIKGIDAQIEFARQQQAKIGASDTEGRNKLLIQIADFEAQKADLVGKASQQQVQSAQAEVKQIQETAERRRNVIESLKSLNAQYFFLQNNLQQLQVLGAKAYSVLLGQNEKLRQEVLSTQSSLVANARIFQDGLQLTDNVEAIQALNEPIRAAIERIRKDSLELVGVTSSDLTQVFQILGNNAASLIDQSKTLKDPIEAASKLTIDFAASLGTIGVPLFQARQEIQSILQGTVDQNSILAKNLNITNDQVRLWRSQGILVDELSKRLKPFVDGNALAARSISGISSNIQEIIEEIQRVSFEPLYEPIVAALDQVYQFLKQNQEGFVEGIQTAAEFVVELAQRIGTALGEIAKIVTPLIQEIGELGLETLGQTAKLGAEGLEALATTLVTLFKVANPLIELLTNILNVLNETGIAAPLLVAAIVSALNPLALLGQSLNLVLLGVSALTAGSVSLSAALATLSTTSLPALLTAIAPLTVSLGALAAAAVTAYAAFRAFELGQLNESIGEYEDRVEQAANKSLDLAIQLKTLRDEIAKGGGSKEDKEQLASLEKQAEARKALNKLTIDSLKELASSANLNPNQRGSVDALVSQLESANSALGVGADQVQILAKELTELGPLYEQLAKNADNARRQLEQGAQGDINIAKKSASELLSITQQQLQAGQISIAQARERYQFILSQTTLTSEELSKAEKALTDLTKLEGDRRVEIIGRQQDEIRQEIARGFLSAETGERQLTRLTIQELKIRLDAIRVQLREEEKLKGGLRGDNALKLLSEQSKIQTQLAQSEQKQREQSQKRESRIAQEQLSLLERDFANRTIQETEYIERKRDIQVKGFDAEIKILREQRNRLSKTDTDGRNTLIAQEAKLEADRANAINQAREALLKKNIDRIERETNVLTQALNKGIAALDIYNRGLSGQNEAIALGNRIFEARNEILQAGFNLTKAQSELATTLAQGESEDAARALQIRKQLEDEKIKGTRLETVLREELAKLTGNSNATEEEVITKRQKAEADLFRLKVEALNREQQQQLQLLDIEQQRLKIQNEQLILQEKIALATAKQGELRQQQAITEGQGQVRSASAELEAAIASGDKGRIEKARAALGLAQSNLQTQQDLLPLAQQQTALRGQSLGFAEEGAERIRQQGQATRQTLLTQQQAQREALRQDGARLASGQRIESATANIAVDQSGAIQGAVNQIGVIPRTGPAIGSISPAVSQLQKGTGFIVLPDGRRVDIRQQPRGGSLTTPSGGQIPIPSGDVVNPSRSTGESIIGELRAIRQSLGRPNISNEVINQISAPTDADLLRKFNQSILQTIDRVVGDAIPAF